MDKDRMVGVRDMTRGTRAGEPTLWRPPSLWSEVVRVAMGGLLEGLAWLTRLHPWAWPRRYGLTVIQDIPYTTPAHPARRLDVWLPSKAMEPRPAVLLVHGGGFRILSKRTHWFMALIFARAGYVVFTIDYRLAPAHPFPAAIEDTCAAFRWVMKNAEHFDADPTRIAFAGESAGANLIVALTLALTTERPEPYAREVYGLGVLPKAILPACGLFQVTNRTRFTADRSMPALYRNRIDDVCRGYLGPWEDRAGEELLMADPVRLLEGDEPLTRAFPPAYLCVGTRDPIAADTHRLAGALERRGYAPVLDLYPGEIHAFHAFLWRTAARRCWSAQLDFLEQHLGCASSNASGAEDIEGPPTLS